MAHNSPFIGSRVLRQGNDRQSHRRDLDRRQCPRYGKSRVSTRTYRRWRVHSKNLRSPNLGPRPTHPLCLVQAEIPARLLGRSATKIPERRIHPLLWRGLLLSVAGIRRPRPEPSGRRRWRRVATLSPEPIIPFAFCKIPTGP